MSDTSSHIQITTEDRDQPDLRRLARALIDLAIEQSQADEVIQESAEEPRAA